MLYKYTTNLVTILALQLVFCTIDINLPELQYLSDHLTEEECHRLVAALHFQSFDIPQQVGAAERKLPNDVSCLDLLLHWNSQSGEGKGNTHVEVTHRLNQIGRRDLAEWLSRTVFHQLSKDLDDSLVAEVTDETTRIPKRVTEAKKETVSDEAPWLTLDSVMAMLIVIVLLVITGGCCYVITLCLQNIHNKYTTNKYKPKQGYKEVNVPSKKPKSVFDNSDDENTNLIFKVSKKQ